LVLALARAEIATPRIGQHRGAGGFAPSPTPTRYGRYPKRTKIIYLMGLKTSAYVANMFVTYHRRSYTQATPARSESWTTAIPRP
jgi:hypothetical protein